MEPSIPQNLPLKCLKREIFSRALDESYQALHRFNRLLADLSPTNRDRLIAKEMKSSKGLPRSAIDLLFKKRKVSFRLLCKIHEKIKRGGGKMRKEQNWIGPEGRGIEEAYFYPPDLPHLKKGLKNLEAYWAIHTEDPLIQLAIWFAQLLILHPFMDGNGRAARLMIPLFLFERKVISRPLFFMSHFFKKHRLAYFYKLYLISTKRRWEGWVLFFLKGIVEEEKAIYRLVPVQRHPRKSNLKLSNFQ